MFLPSQGRIYDQHLSAPDLLHAQPAGYHHSARVSKDQKSLKELVNFTGALGKSASPEEWDFVSAGLNHFQLAVVWVEGPLHVHSVEDDVILVAEGVGSLLLGKVEDLVILGQVKEALVLHAWVLAGDVQESRSVHHKHSVGAVLISH